VTSRRLVLAACGLALITSLTGCGSDSSGTHAGMSDPGMTTSSGASNSAASGPTSSADRAGDIVFAQSMIPHHQQAIEMADLALESASSAEVKALATQIKAAQDPEIQTMRGWLTSWGASEEMGTDHSGMNHSDLSDMAGMMSDEDMVKLAGATGAGFDTMWLQLMVVHHQGAVSAADDVLSSTQDPAVKTLALAVIDGQNAEIDAMMDLLVG